MLRLNKLNFTIAVLAMLAVFKPAFAQKPVIKAEEARSKYSNSIKIEPMDGGVKIERNTITFSPKKEGTTYLISGYFDGQIINKTKNTVLKLNNAFLENHNGLLEAELHQLFREQLGTKIQALVNPNPLPAPSAWRWLLLPLWPVAALLSLPLWLTAELICRKVNDKAFCNSVRLLAKVILTPIFLIFWAILLFLLLPWQLATALLLLYLFSYSIFYDIIYLTFAKCESYQR